MDDLVTWLRAQIDEDKRIAQAATDDDYMSIEDCSAAMQACWDRFDPEHMMAQCEAHSRILDFVESNSPHHIEVNTNDHSGDFLGAMFLTLKMRDLLASVATAYQHRPGYEDATATLKTAQPEVSLSLSKEARGDELAARRYKTDPPDGDRG